MAIAVGSDLGRATSGAWPETKGFDGLRLPLPNAYNVRPDCLKIIVFHFGIEPQAARVKQLIVRSLS